MLQEETAARKSHWRRAKLKEQEMAEAERKLAEQILFNFESMKLGSLKKTISSLQQVRERQCCHKWTASFLWFYTTMFSQMNNDLSEMERRETQRRHDAEEEYSAVLPPDVVSILTEVDSPEHDSNTTHCSSHNRLTEVRGGGGGLLCLFSPFCVLTCKLYFNKPPFLFLYVFFFSPPPPPVSLHTATRAQLTLATASLSREMCSQQKQMRGIMDNPPYCFISALCLYFSQRYSL